MEWDDIRNGAIWAPAIAAGLVVAWFSCLKLRDWWKRRKRLKVGPVPRIPETSSDESAF